MRLRACSPLLLSVVLLSCGGEPKTPAAPSPALPTVTYTVSGMVRDALGTPLEAARVSMAIPLSKTGPSFSTETDATGRYRGNLAAGSHYTLYAQRPGFENFYRTDVSISADTLLDDVTLRPGVQVSGKVSEAGVGPLDDATIEVVSGPNAGRSTLTGHPISGQYVLDHLSPGEFKLRASKSGYETVEQTVQATTNTNLNFSMKWSYGTCLQSVAPVSFAPYPSAGGTESAMVDANAGRSWTATSDAPWIQLLSSATRTGSGQVTFRVQPHAVGDKEPRKGAVMIRCMASEGQNIWITQSPDCQVRLDSASPAVFGGAGGTGQVSVRTGTTGCHWEATSQTDWMYIVGVRSGRGDSYVQFVVNANPTRQERTGLIVVGETTWEVRQR